MKTVNDIPAWLHNMVVYHKGQWPGGEYIYTNNGACTRSYYMEATRLITGEPDDSEAPEWANWKARMDTGTWFWFETKPVCSMRHWSVFLGDGGMIERASKGVPLGPWRNTLKPVSRSIDRRPVDEYEQQGWDEHEQRLRQNKGKYDDVLTPFVRLMEKELHANSGKGDRPGWLSMSPDQVMIGIYYHAAKLQKALRDDDMEGVTEYSADVANMAMMALDVCGGLDHMERDQ